MKTIRFNTMGSMSVPKDWTIRPNWPQEGNDPSGSSMNANGLVVNLVVGLSVYDPATGVTTYTSLEDKNSLVPAVVVDYKFRDFMEVE